MVHSDGEIEVLRTQTFDTWLKSLRDHQARAQILVRIQRLARGNPGEVAPIGEGVSELRIHTGPGYRIYFARRGARLILILAGGDKSTQPADIARAKSIAAAWSP